MCVQSLPNYTDVDYGYQMIGNVVPANLEYIVVLKIKLFLLKS